jgi:hypothetical protein
MTQDAFGILLICLMGFSFFLGAVIIGLLVDLVLNKVWYGIWTVTWQNRYLLVMYVILDIVYWAIIFFIFI